MSTARRWYLTACVLAFASCTCAPSGAGPRLTVELAGDGVGFVTSSPSGINCPGACTLAVPLRTEVTLSASPSVAGTTFVGWSGPCSGLEPCRVTVLQSEEKVIAAFALRNSLVVTRVGTGRGTVRSEPAGIDCGDDCSEIFAPQTEVTLSVAAEAGSTFEGWSGACAGKEACVVSAAQAQLVTATFAAIMVPLTVEVVGAGSGTIVSTPPGLTCSASQCVAQFRQGTQVALRANNTAGSTFVAWGGSCSGTSPSCSVLMNEATSVTGQFELVLPISIRPATVTLARSESFTFTAAGGITPYRFSLAQGNGAMDPSGRYTAPAFETNDTVRVTDARGSIANAMVRVVLTEPLTLAPATQTLSRDQSFTFVASGGRPPYLFSVDGAAGSGFIDSAGRFTAPTFDADVTVRVTDSAGGTAQANVFVRGPALRLTPSAVVLSAGATFRFTAHDGRPPYAFVVLNGQGAIDATGLYTAQPRVGFAVVRVRDSASAFADAQVTIQLATDGGVTDAGVVTDGGFVSDAGLFAPAATTTIVGLPSEVITGDWNDDGQADLAVLSNGTTFVFAVRVGSTFVETQTLAQVGAHPVTGDWNRDGKLDVVVGGTNIVRVLLGVGDGTFQSQAGQPVSAPLSGSTTADFNRDGLPDLALSSSSPGGLSILLGRGDGTFQPPSFDSLAGNCSSVTSGDWNRDGKPDLALACTPNVVRVRLGVGDGTFGARVDFAVAQGPTQVTSCALNADGVADLVVIGAMGEVSTLLGVVDGTFAAANTLTSGAPDPVAALAVGDWDTDGRMDLALARTASASLGFLLGNGDGTFRSSSWSIVTPAWLAPLDWDRDGRPDLVITSTAANATMVFVNESPYVPALFRRVDSVGGNQPFLLWPDDWDRDGRADMAICDVDGASLSLGRGDGSFLAGLGLFGGSTAAMTSGDWNRDGKPDLALSAGPVTVFLGGSDGGFVPGMGMDAGVNPTGLVTGDWNRDGRPDLVSTGSSVELFRGVGDGTFLPALALDAGTNPVAATSGDWNRDGKLDLAVANQASNEVTVLLGVGDGSFRLPVSYPLGGSPLSVSAADLNRDGTLDLVVATSTNVSILRGAGNGTFLPLVPLAVSSARMAICGDWNLDGWPDIAVATPGTLVLRFGIDGAAFSATNYPLTAAVGLTSADWNQDGKPDLAVAQPTINTITYFLSDF